MLSLINTTKVIKRIVERKYSGTHTVTKEEFSSFIKCINAGIVKATKHPYFIAAVEQRYAKYGSKEAFNDSAVYVTKYDPIVSDIIYETCIEELRKDSSISHYADYGLNIGPEYAKFIAEYPECKC